MMVSASRPMWIGNKRCMSARFAFIRRWWPIIWILWIGFLFITGLGFGLDNYKEGPYWFFAGLGLATLVSVILTLLGLLVRWWIFRKRSVAPRTGQSTGCLLIMALVLSCLAFIISWASPQHQDTAKLNGHVYYLARQDFYNAAIGYWFIEVYECDDSYSWNCHKLEQADHECNSTGVQASIPGHLTLEADPAHDLLVIRKNGRVFCNVHVESR
jgi:hypothetical protein